MAKIFLIRHGQDCDNKNGILNGHRDTSLTDLGRQQSLLVASRLKKENIEIIYSSPLKRTYETALIIGNILEVGKIIIEKDLIERNFGILTGKPICEISKYAKKIVKNDGIDYFIEAKGIETFLTTHQRAELIFK